jgi:uncharacterized protein (TIGR00251 family)
VAVFAITSVPGGVVFDVRVIPRAAKSGVAGVRDAAVLVRLNAPPVEGAANEELIEVVAGALGVARRAVTLVSGARSRQKRVQVLGVSAAAVAELLGRQSR